MNDKPDEVTIYDATTGALLRTFTGPEGSYLQQLQPGEAAWDGILPLNCCSIDIPTLTVVDFVPDAPGPGMEWNSDLKEHVLTEAGLRSREVFAEIRALEISQIRVLRELSIDPTVVGSDGKTPPERLQDIEDAIALIRGELVL